jgi:hypothetical protein
MKEQIIPPFFEGNVQAMIVNVDSAIKAYVHRIVKYPWSTTFSGRRTPRCSSSGCRAAAAGAGSPFIIGVCVPSSASIILNQIWEQHL